MDKDMYVQCDRCRTRFLRPLPAKGSSHATGGVLSCPRCFHFIVIDDAAPDAAPDGDNTG
jgi:hypothetical protein